MALKTEIRRAFRSGGRLPQLGQAFSPTSNGTSACRSTVAMVATSLVACHPSGKPKQCTHIYHRAPRGDRVRCDDYRFPIGRW
jgi:hypothetical protein